MCPEQDLLTPGQDSRKYGLKLSHVSLLSTRYTHAYLAWKYKNIKSFTYHSLSTYKIELKVNL